MIVEIFVTQRESEDTLLDEFFEGVLDQFRVAVVVETAGEAGQQAGPRLHLAQQQTAGVGSNRASIETGRLLGS